MIVQTPEQVTAMPEASARPTTLATALVEVEAKRSVDVIRFRTCCADPRASK